MERKQLSVRFFIKRARVLKNGETSVRVRITYDGIRVEAPINRTVPVNQWSQPRGCSLGRTRAANELNAYLDTVRSKILEIHHNLERDGELVAAIQIRDRYLGRGVEVRTLKSVFLDHNEKCRKLIGIDYQAVTVGRYDNCLKYLLECIKINYNKDDLSLNEINPELVRNFEFFLKTEKRCAQNTVNRYMKHFKRITNLAISNNWMSRNPFVGMKFREAAVHKEFLTQVEIDMIQNKEITIERLDLVRDVFLFCCYTGLAFVDVLNLRKEHLVVDNDDEVWIYKTREKTDNMCNIPLLPLPEQILEKYKDHHICQAKYSVPQS